MNSNAKTVIKNLYYTVAANFATLAISILLNLFVPKLLGVREYSYWQLYVFYSSYVGFLHFGWVDGMYLKIGGENYDDLNKRVIGSQYWYLCGLEVILSTIVAMIALFILPPSNQSQILFLTAVVSVITIAKTFILYIFQSTNRIKEYAQLSRMDRYLYVVMIAVYFIMGGRNFFWLIMMDIVSKLVMTIWGMTRIKDMLTLKVLPVRSLFKEIVDNINIGSKLMLSSVASMLILGTIRFFVQKQWSIEVFGKLSFTLSISNMFLTFINAIGIVMFPLLRRTDQKKLPSLFVTLRTLFVPITYSFLIFYVPVRYILVSWLPQYAVSLDYMGILFPMVIYEGRMSLLLNTYLKALRKEKTILLVNIVTLSITLITGSVVIFIMKNLTLAVCLIIFSLALRCNLAEFALVRSLKVKLGRRIIVENGLSLLFIVSNIVATSWESLALYTVGYIVFLLIYSRSIKKSFKEFYGLIRS